MTDMYEYTMLDACLRDGTANRKCVFEIFTAAAASAETVPSISAVKYRLSVRG